MKRRTRILLWVIAAVPLLPLAALLGLALLARLLYPWPDPVPGVRLEPLHPPLPDNQIRPDNAYYYLRQLTRIPHDPAVGDWSSPLDYQFQEIGWEAGRFSACERRLTELEPQLKLLDQAAAAPRAQSPIIKWNTWPSWHEQTAEFLRLLPVDAERAGAENRWDDASRDLCLVIGVAAHLTHGGDFQWNRRGLEFAAPSLRRLALERKPPTLWLREMIRCVQEADAYMDPQIEGLRHRRLKHLQCPDLLFTHLERLPHCLRRDFSEGWILDGLTPETPKDRMRAAAYRPLVWLCGSSPERSRRHLDTMLSYYLTAVETDDRSYAPFRRLRKPEWNSWGFWLWELNDPVARSIVSGMEIPDLGFSLTEQQDQWLEVVTRLRVAELTCAIRLYQGEHAGKPPETLAALAPQYVAKVPDDPFASPGTPLGYRVNPDGVFVVWSRGEDRVDHGGRYNIGRPFAPDAAKHWKERDYVFASDDFPRLRAYKLEELRHEAELRGHPMTQQELRKAWPGFFGSP